MKVLDSDHCIALLRGRLNLRDRVAPTEELAVTTVSVGELVHGAHRSARVSENLAQIDVFLAALTILPFDEPSARRFGAVKAELEVAGMILADLDLQIACITLQHASLLVTHNRKHFERVRGLVLDDWL